MNKFLTDSVRQRILAVGCISLATDSVTFGTGQQTRATKDNAHDKGIGSALQIESFEYLL